MPHIVLEGPVDLRKFYTHYRPSALQTEGEILKLQNIFISQGNNMVLIEAVAVEGGPPNRFFVQAGTKGSKTTVRIYPGTDPEKTHGVKKLLALAAKQLKDQNPEIRYGTTNLKDFLL
jgi:hypothetical protein